MNKKYMALAVLAAMTVSFNANAEGKDGVAAVVNGEKITVSEIKQGYNDNPQIKDRVKFDEFYPKALDIFVNGKILLQAAEGEKVMDSPEYKKQLELAKDEIARKVYLEKRVNAKITSSELNKLYAEYKSKFKSEKEVKAKHILVDSEVKAKEVIAKLDKGGNFDTLAKEYSKEPADLGYFTKNMMVPDFANNVFAMKKGDYSKTPIKTQFGYHVAMVEDIRDTKPLSQKDVEPQLRGILTQQAIGEVFGSLVKNAKIEKYDLKGSVIKDAVIPNAQ